MSGTNVLENLTAGVTKAVVDMLKCDESVSYIFYTTGYKSDFSVQAEWRKKQLEEQGKTVIMVPVASASDFVDGWNQMGNTSKGIADIENVEIYTHSNATTFIFQDGSSTEALSISGYNKSKQKINGTSDLPYKDVDVLNIYGCNAGNLSTYINDKKNIASEFSKLVSGDVYAYDGNVAFGPTEWQPFKEYGEYEDRLSNRQDSYVKISWKNKWFHHKNRTVCNCSDIFNQCLVLFPKLCQTNRWSNSGVFDHCKVIDTNQYGYKIRF